MLASPFEILGAVGFALAQLASLLGLPLLTIPELNKRRQKYVTCIQRLNGYKLSVVALESKYRSWKNTWERGTNPFSEADYRALWTDKYNNIEGAKTLISDLLNVVWTTMDDIIKEKGGTSLWQKTGTAVSKAMRMVSFRGQPAQDLKVWRRIAFALSTDTKLKETIDRLNQAMKDLEDLCQGEYDRQIGNRSTSNVTTESVARLQNLNRFFNPLSALISTIYTKRSSPEHTMAWSVILRLPDETAKIVNWDQLESVRVDFTFSMQPPLPGGKQISLSIIYWPEGQDIDPINAVEWEHIIRGNGDDGDDGVDGDDGDDGDDGAEFRRDLQQPSRKTLSFGELFREGFFQDDRAFHSWRLCRAELLNSLCSWSLLLWNTNWTNDLCCFGLHYLRRHGQVQGGDIRDDSSVHALAVDLTHPDHCQHKTQKLRRFGLVLAELVITTNIRQVVDTRPPKYQMWSKETGTWGPISGTVIVNKVRDRSSVKISEVVKFCIDEASAKDPSFEMGYLLSYITKIYEPIEEWYKEEVRDKADYDHLRNPDIWPGKALQLEHLNAENEIHDNQSHNYGYGEEAMDQCALKYGHLQPLPVNNQMPVIPVQNNIHGRNVINVPALKGARAAEPDPHQVDHQRHEQREHVGEHKQEKMYHQPALGEIAPDEEKDEEDSDSGFYTPIEREINAF